MAINKPSSPPRILVAGCGALGGDIARRLTHDGEVYGLRRTRAAVPEGVIPAPADLMDRQSLRQAVPACPEIIIYCLTPSSYDDDGYHAAYVQGLANLLDSVDTSNLRRLFFVSSSSVYGQNDDSEVDETSATEPARYSGLRVLEGEALTLAQAYPGTVVRFSGIYGPTRRRFLESVQQGEIEPEQPAPYTNRIHEEDAARTLVHLVSKTLAGEPVAPCYLASDCRPARLDEVVGWIRAHTPCAAPVANARTGGRAGSKRCCNQRLLDSGFEFRFPDFRAGYGAMIGDSGIS